MNNNSKRMIEFRFTHAVSTNINQSFPTVRGNPLTLTPLIHDSMNVMIFTSNNKQYQQ